MSPNAELQALLVDESTLYDMLIIHLQDENQELTASGAAAVGLVDKSREKLALCNQISVHAEARHSLLRDAFSVEPTESNCLSVSEGIGLANEAKELYAKAKKAHQLHLVNVGIVEQLMGHTRKALAQLGANAADSLYGSDGTTRYRRQKVSVSV